MRKRKPEIFENPVLHFGSDVAKDLIVEAICTHFKKAARGLSDWQNHMHLGMLKALENNKTTKELRVWLYKQLPKEHHPKIAGLLARFIRIQDSEVRRESFLAGQQDFWNASRIVKSPRSTKQTYIDLVNRIAWCLIKQEISVKQFTSDVETRINEINSCND